MTATDKLLRPPKCTRIAGKWYNLTVQVAAGQKIKYTAECAIGVEPLPPADGVSFGVAAKNDET